MPSLDIQKNIDGHMNHYSLTTNNYTIRYETFQGRRHLVVPCVLMVEGVHCGSHGPILHTSEELGRFPQSWDGIPVSIQHPSDDNGLPISCNQPHVIDLQVVGRVFNTFIDGDKLRAEAWISLDDITRIAPEALEYLRNGQPMDVSVGVFTEDDMTSGDWNGEHYEAIARNHRPDHLALLPAINGNSGRGACSWTDGCGVRANSFQANANQETPQGGEIDMKEETKTYSINLLFGKDYLFMVNGSQGDDKINVNEFALYKAMVRAGLSVDQMSFDEISSKIQTKLDAMDDDTKFHFLVETYPDYFIYKVRFRTDSQMEGENLFKRTYSIGQDGKVEFTGESQPVVRQVEYITQSNDGGTNMAKEKEKTCCAEKVELLIQSDQTNFEDTDREWLLTLSEGQIDKLQPKAVEKEVETKVEAPQMNREQAIQVLKDLSDDEKMSLLTPETRAIIDYGQKLYKAERQQKIDHILANTDVYSSERLAAMTDQDLHDLARAIKVPVSFAPLGPTPPPQANSEIDEKLLPPGVA